jgi:pyruvyltransferase
MLAWWLNMDNFGDALNPVLINFISGKTPKNLCTNLIGTKISFNIKERFKQIIKKEPIYLVIGSTLQWANNKNLVIWGAGFISSDCKLKKKPMKICAVRGPCTRDIILKQGFDCPEVYGDPVLLLPKYYKPMIKKRYKLGIIPHINDKSNHLINKFKGIEDILIIDIESDTMNVVNYILSCEKIASSSLHGIIVADAYDIPSIWVKFSDKVKGKGFKFEDYFESIKRNDKEPLIIDNNSNLDDIYNKFSKSKINIDLDKLYDSCPFKVN